MTLRRRGPHLQENMEKILPGAPATVLHGIYRDDGKLQFGSVEVGNQQNGNGLKLYVGNLPYRVDEARLREEFGRYGAITECLIIADRGTGISKGFGFITYERSQDGYTAIEKMDGADFGGRALKVSLARPRD